MLRSREETSMLLRFGEASEANTVAIVVHKSPICQKSGAFC